MRFKWLLLAGLLCIAPPALSYWQTRQQSSVGCVVTNAPSGGIYDTTTFGGWLTVAASGAANQAIAPDCTLTAPSVFENTANDHHGIGIFVTFTVLAQPYTHTAYMKQLVGSRNGRIEITSSNTTSLVSLVVNLPACTLQALTTEGSYSIGTASYTAVLQSNGWCKASVTVTPYADTSLGLGLSLVSGTNVIYTGDGSSSIVLWGDDLR